MADWESHHDVLEDLYMKKDKALGSVMKQMRQEHNFVASKAQYEKQFKKWNWRKKMNDDEWKYVARKFNLRKSRSTTVFFRNKKIETSTVAKEIKRHFHPNDEFIFGSMPATPVDLLVCTPPSLDPSFNSSNSSPAPFRSDTGTKRSWEESPGPLPLNPKRQCMQDSRSEIGLEVIPAHDTTVYDCRQMSSTQVVVRFKDRPPMNLENLPFSKFKDFMQSPDVQHRLEVMISGERNAIENFRPNSFPNQLECSNSSVYTEPFGEDLERDMSDMLSAVTLVPNASRRVHEPFEANFLNLRSGYFDSFHLRNADTMDLLQNAELEVKGLIKSIPQRKITDIQANIDLLLGPPNVQAAQVFVEMVAYASSNNLLWGDRLIRWILQNISWSAVKPIFEIELATIQSIAGEFLQIAAELGKLSVVQDLLKHSLLTAFVMSNGDVLLGAVRSSNAELVGLLLTKGADPNMPFRRGYNPYSELPLHNAATVDVARKLVESGADINGIERTYAGLEGPPLTPAILSGRVNLCRYLIREGANVHMPANIHEWAVRQLRKRNVTMVFLATCCQEVEILEELLGAGAEVNARCNQPSHWDLHRPAHFDNIGGPTAKATALQMAAKTGNLKLAKLLLEYKADVNAPADDDPEGETALQAATASGCTEMVTLLLANGADIDARVGPPSRPPKTALHTAVELNRYDLVEILLDAGANVNAPSSGYFGSSILGSARANPEASKIVDLLVERRAFDLEPDNDSYKRVLLHDAISKGDLSRTRALLGSGIHIDMDIYDYEPYLFLCSPTYYDSRGTILHWALDSAPAGEININLFRLLVNNIQDINTQINQPDVPSILHEAIAYDWRCTELVGVLLEAGADATALSLDINLELDFPLAAAAYRNNLDVVQLLLAKGAGVNAYNPSSHPSTALQASLLNWRGNFDVFNHLLQQGASINAPVAACEGMSELALACSHGKLEIVKQLLDLGADVNSPAAGIGGRTALQAAAMNGNLEIVQLLFEKGADLSAPRGQQNGMTALEAAAEMGYFQIAVLLIEAGADVNPVRPEATLVQGVMDEDAKNFYASTALERAIRVGRLDMVYLLLEAGADIHATMRTYDYNRGRQVLGRYVSAPELARASGHIVIAEMLEKWKEDHKVPE